MAPEIDDAEARQLAHQVAALAGEDEAEAVRQALRERRDRLKLHGGAGRRPPGGLLRLMETEIWPLIPAEHRGRPPMSKAEREEILGYGPQGF